MHNPALIEESFKRFLKKLPSLPLESLVIVDLELLHQFDLLDYHKNSHYDPSLTRYFQVLESAEKITLANDDFVVWIVPEKTGKDRQTFTFIAINHPDEAPRLELVFINSGVFNTSRLVLRVLEIFLRDIEENQHILNKYKIV